MPDKLVIKEFAIEDFQSDPGKYEKQLVLLQFHDYFSSEDIFPVYCGTIEELEKNKGGVYWFTLKNFHVLDVKECAGIQDRGFRYLDEKNLLADIYQECLSSAVESESQNVLHFQNGAVIGKP